MARDGGYNSERLALLIVEAEIIAASPGVAIRRLGKVEDSARGFDLEVTHADGQIDQVEVKGQGEPMFRADGRFTYPIEIREAQLRASADPAWRLELVADLARCIAEPGHPPSRLTVTGASIAAERARLLALLDDSAWQEGHLAIAKLNLKLDGREAEVQASTPPSKESIEASTTSVS